MSWWHSYRSVSRDELMTGALALVDHGWPVLPGTFWQGRRWAGTPGGTRSGPVPVPVDGLAGASADRAAVIRWWSELPYSVLLPTGSALDAIEVSPSAGRRLCAHLRQAGIVAPAGTTSTGRWWFLVTAGEPLRPELECRSDVTLHGRGSWIVAPPSQDPQGDVQWCVPPPSVGATRHSAPRVGFIPTSRADSDQPQRGPSPDTQRSGPGPLPDTYKLPDTYDVQLALLEVLGQRSMLAAAASAVDAVRAHRWP